LQADLRDKLKSKFDVAKFFIGAIVINASILLSTPVSSVWSQSINRAVKFLMFFGSATLAASLILAVGTLLALDNLTMPKEFWSEKQKSLRSAHGEKIPEPPKWSVLRPPSEATVVLFYEMIHTWQSIFLPALSTAVISIASFLLAIIATKLNWNPLMTLQIASITIVCGVLLIAYYWRNKPKLGFED
jgi:hypothetical protein